jgi:Alginate export
MKNCFLPALFAVALAGGRPLDLFGQTQTPPPAAASSASNQTQSNPDQNDQDQNAAEGNYWQRTFHLSGSIRERWEATDGPFSVTPAASYVVSQIRLGLGYEPTGWLHFFAQAQDVRPLFYGATPSNAFYNPFDLHQAWVAIGQPEGPGVFVQVGRQDMVIGSGHLLASTDDWWVYTDRDFDVINGSYTNKYFKSQFVAGSVILVNPYAPDEHRPGDHIYADYNTFPHLLPGASVEPYLIAHTSDDVKSKEELLGNADTLALGLRIAGKLPHGVDYNIEPLHEFGGYSNDRLDANGFLTGAGWSITSGDWKPRLSADYEFASGDDGKKNGTRENFDNMFGYNYPMNSLTGLFDWKNLKDLRAGVEVAPRKNLKIKLNARDYWLANVHDGFYNAYGTRIVFDPSATSAHIGEGVETMVTAKLAKKTTAGFGLGVLFPGEYLKQAGKDQAFLYPYFYLAQIF